MLERDAAHRTIQCPMLMSARARALRRAEFFNFFLIFSLTSFSSAGLTYPAWKNGYLHLSLIFSTSPITVFLNLWMLLSWEYPGFP